MSLTPITRTLADATLAGLSFSSPTVAQGVSNSSGWQNGWGPGYMMGQGNMPGPGYMMGQGYMNGPGYMMGQGHMPGPGYMMAPNFQQQGPGGSGWMRQFQQDLDVDDVKTMMEQRLGWMNNPNIKLGSVDEKDEDTITAEIVTKEGSLVQRLTVDRHTGWIQPSQ